MKKNSFSRNFSIFFWSNKEAIHTHFNLNIGQYVPLNISSFFDFIEKKLIVYNNGLPLTVTSTNISDNYPPNPTSLYSPTYSILTKSYNIVTGSTNEEIARRFVQKQFNETSFNEEYDNQKHYIYVNCNMHRLEFDDEHFSKKCNEIKRNLTKIILIENLNPRPETLNNDLFKLKKVFSQADLRRFLEIHFTVYESNDATSLKSYILEYDVLFDSLGIQDNEQKVEFFEKRIFTFNK